MTTIALVVMGYLVFLGFVLSLLAAAKRGDEALGRSGPSVEVLRDREPLGRIAADVHHLLGAERVTVIVGEGEHRESGLVAACFGAPGLLGARIPVAAETSAGVLHPEEAAALGLAGGTSWSFAHIPLDGPEGVSGAITVATRRPNAFTPGELGRIERLARRGAPEFERRRFARTAS
jgi:hypothetical protein